MVATPDLHQFTVIVEATVTSKCGVTALRGHGMWGYCLKRPWYVGLLP